MKICKKCSFGGMGKSIRGRGNPDADLFIVGESPGNLELLMSEPFVGESGGLLNWFLRESKIIKNEDYRYKNIFFDNALQCYPSHNSLTKEKANISVQQLIMCTNLYLDKNIKRVKPKIVLCLGSSALKSVLKDYKISIKDCKSFWFFSEEYNAWILGTYHPAKVLNNWGDTSLVLKDFERVKFALDYGVPEQKVGKNYTLIKEFKEVKKLFRDLKKKKRIAWDIESTSTEFWTKSEDILGFSFSWKEGQAVWLPLRKSGDYKNKKLWKDKQFSFILKELKTILEDEKLKKDGANLKFDINWCISKYQIIPRGLDWDITMFHHLIDENTPANLTYLTAYYNLNFPRYEGKIDPYIQKHPTIQKSKTYEFIPQDILGFYGCADADATFRISKIQRKIASNRQKDLYYKQSIALSKVCRSMEESGALIAVKKIDVLSKLYEVQINEKERKLGGLLKLSGLNVNSPKQVVNLLYTVMGFPVIQKTKTGNPSTGKDTLLLLERETKSKKKLKVLESISEIRTMKKLKSTYLDGFKKIVDKNNRVHTNYLSIGTVTGRIASTKPNLMNIPRDPIFRSLFIAGKNRRLVVADYSQMEDRNLAFLAEETKLLKLYENAEFDPHTITSSMVRKIPFEEVTKDQRSFDKAVKFGMNYGRSNKSIAETYDLPLEEVDEFVFNYFDTYKRIKKFRESCIKLSKKNFYLQTPSGRRRNFSAYKWLYSTEMSNVASRREDLGVSNYVIQAVIGNMERQALNFKIQSFSFDLMIRAMDRIRLELKDKFPESHLVLQVHDMVAIDSPKKDAKKVKKLMEKCMTTTLVKKNGVSTTFPVDINVGKCWVQ